MALEIYIILHNSIFLNFWIFTFWKSVKYLKWFNKIKWNHPKIFFAFNFSPILDFEALDAELDHLNSALDKMENWSTSLHDKVAEFLKETQEQNKQAKTTTTTSPGEPDSSNCSNGASSAATTDDLSKDNASSSAQNSEKATTDEKNVKDEK